MLEMVIEVESCLFDNCNFTVIEKLSANNIAHLSRKVLLLGGGYVTASIYLSVYLIMNKIAQKVVNGF